MNLHANFNFNAQIIYFAGRDVKKESVAWVDPKLPIKLYTTTIMGIVFTSDELATCSMTGSTSNFQQAGGAAAAEAKKKLLPQAIRDAVEGM